MNGATAVDAGATLVVAPLTTRQAMEQSHLPPGNPGGCPGRYQTNRARGQTTVATSKVCRP